jgi:hypothetical protein
MAIHLDVHNKLRSRLDIFIHVHIVIPVLLATVPVGREVPIAENTPIVGIESIVITAIAEEVINFITSLVKGIFGVGHGEEVVSAEVSGVSVAGGVQLNCSRFWKGLKAQDLKVGGWARGNAVRPDAVQGWRSGG